MPAFQHTKTTQRQFKTRKVMSNKFDELAKSMAQSLSRRQALKKFGAGLVGGVLAAVGFVNKAEANPSIRCNCKKPNYGCDRYALGYSECTLKCSTECSP